jgi:hypothetical protein
MVSVAVCWSRSVTSRLRASPVRIPVAAINAISVWSVAALIAGRSWSATASSSAISAWV